MTLEAFADTIVPGEKRSPDDRAVAGASPGGGAVAAGAIELLETPATGVSTVLDDYARMLNEHARTHATEHGLGLDETVPPFVALPFEDRTAVVRKLTGQDQEDRELWVLLALFSNMAFDTAAHMHTADAMAAGHPGLVTMGFMKADDDGLWRFPDFSYGRRLADPHPDTTPTGSPA
ncbi:DUF5987 family protein [Kitasatospora sp. SUK 42]|uniref:DUF5987 family protein n=1 Tax=Kitasatospora sp. SUK 42 TaxID=1588882 RepID=UPI0018CBB8A7|nr:DUF5987 family protein [Kitasatospora sp. SUK 42]MBV2156604.1 regulator [Kitasatospora sp. SUK 42]